MTGVISKLDDMGQAAWIGVLVLSFIVFWPAGLAILAYLIWSGRMSCGRYWNSGTDGASRWERKMQRFQSKMDRWQAGNMPPPFGGSRGFAPSGNRAFDEYREATLKRLEDEFAEFKGFLDRLREAKDKSEFEQFMADRRNRAENQGGSQQGNSGRNDGPWPPDTNTPPRV